jgi:phosphoesterase RecJ-like protein
MPQRRTGLRSLHVTLGDDAPFCDPWATAPVGRGVPVQRLSGFPFAPWFLARLQQAQRLVLMTHVNPDADGLGAQLAFAAAARAAGRKVTIVNEDPCPSRYAWMDPLRTIRAFDSAADEIEGADLALIFDAHEISRAARPAHRARALGIAVWVVDHHPCRPDEDIEGVIAAEFSSTGELAWRLIEALGWPRDAEAAAAVYAAMSFDTGSFRFIRNNPQTMRTAAELLETGMDANPIQEALFASRTRGELALMGRALHELRYAADGRIAWAVLPPDITAGLEIGEDAFGELIPTFIGIEGVLIAALFKPGKQAGEYKLSLRSKTAVRVGDVARRRGGGGHDHAAGATLYGDPQAHAAAVLAELEACLRDQVDG